MTSSTNADESGGGPRNAQSAPPIAGAKQFPNELGSGDEVQPAPPPAAAARGRNDVLRAGLATTVVPVALGLMLGIAYLGYAHVQRQMKAQHAELQSLKDTQHAELQSLKDKIQGMAAAQSRTDVEHSQPSMNEIQGLLNHVDTLRVQPKQRHPKQQKR